MIKFNIDTNACVVLTDRLERLNKSALPVAVRQTLNNAAFDVKQKTLEQSANKNFIRRAPTFFKKFSGVNKASGFDMRSMKAEVGMTAQGVQTAETAVSNMAIQEFGGAIRKGADYLKAARAGSLGRKVTKANYFNKNRLVKGNFKRANTSKSKFVAAAYVSLREKKQVSVQTIKGRFLMQVTGIRKSKKGQLKIKSKLILKDRTLKPAKITATNFSREAAFMTVAKMDGMFRVEAEKQFARALR